MHAIIIKVVHNTMFLISRLWLVSITNRWRGVFEPLLDLPPIPDWHHPLEYVILNDSLTTFRLLPCGHRG